MDNLESPIMAKSGEPFMITSPLFSLACLFSTERRLPVSLIWRLSEIILSICTSRQLYAPRICLSQM